MAKKIGIIAIKGGVGKTTVSANLAIAIAQQGKKVLAVDANFSAPNLGLHLGIIEPTYTLHDVFSGRVGIAKAVYRHELGFNFILSSLKKERRIRHNELKRELSKIEHLYDYIVIDSSPNLNEETLSAMMASDELFVVTSPDTTTLSTTLYAVKKAKERGTRITGLLLNKYYGKDFELSFEDIEQASGVPILAAFKHNINFAKATCNQRPLLAENANSFAAQEYRDLAACITKEQKTNIFTTIRRKIYTSPTERNRLSLN
ncbi:AAA family ATPase [Candidatus Woesearchaeota archaeon]|nr:AAA family ATPase [Candidatus Woesearchaeota archaeon]